MDPTLTVSVSATDPSPALTATYDPADNKLRLRSLHPLDAETYARVKTAGFRWAPRQDLFVAPAWTPEREDLLLELCGEIGDEDTNLVDRAEERAERFDRYAEHRAADAEAARASVDAITSAIPLGQPILIGHHSEKRARKDAEKIRSGIRRELRLWETASYWERRAKGAVAHAKYKELPGVRHRRIKGLEADTRRHAKASQESELLLRAWRRDDLTREDAIRIANNLTAEQAASIAIPKHERAIERAARWLEHLGFRIAYERAMLDEQGGIVTDHQDLAIGGTVSVRTSRGDRWVTITTINRGAGGAVQSVSTNNDSWPRVVPVEKIRGYRAPEAGAAEKVKVAKKLPPIVNFPSPDARTMTSAEWKAHVKSSEFYQLRRHDATPEHGAYRQREAPIAGGGGWKTQPVYLTDAKRVDVPSPEVQEGAALPRETVPRAPRAILEPSTAKARADALRGALRAGVQVVTAPDLFPTPPHLAHAMVGLADLAARIGEGRARVLEPSAGTGRILQEIKEAPARDVVAIERESGLASALAARFPSVKVYARDFLEVEPEEIDRFDVVLMNPPFSCGADVAHVEHAWEFVEPGGILVAIMAAGIRVRNEYAYRQLRAAIEAHGSIEDLPEDTFRESGTSVRAALVTMRKGAP